MYINGLSQYNLEDVIIKEQFNRERNLDTIIKFIPENIIIVGLGGIGGHIAEILGSLSHIKRMILIDPDNIEMSNLNRTVYKYSQIGENKAIAAAAIISDRNLKIEVFPIPFIITEENHKNIKLENMYSATNWVVIDARDNFYEDYDLFKQLISPYGRRFKPVRAAYNGMSITIDMFPEEHPVWGSGSGYTLIPSHSVPSRLVALLCIISMAHMFENNCIGRSNAFFKNPLTFNCEEIINYLYIGKIIKEELQLDKSGLKKLIEDIRDSKLKDLNK